MSPELIIMISVILGTGLLLAILKFGVAAARKKLENHIQKRFDGIEIMAATAKANFLGRQSRGGRQIRGNGALVLTKGELCFVRAAPFKDYSIPIESITAVTLPDSFNGKSVCSKLLSVQYQLDSEPDAMAWAIEKPEKWKEMIDKLVSKNDQVPAI